MSPKNLQIRVDGFTFYFPASSYDIQSKEIRYDDAERVVKAILP